MVNSETVWEFSTKRFCVHLEITPDYGYSYDGNDEGGETQARLDNGEYVAFDSRVVVKLDGREIGSGSLGGSIYETNNVRQFWTAHRSADPMNRNCSIMRKSRGDNIVICHYFPDMVRTAIDKARKYLANSPHVRAA